MGVQDGEKQNMWEIKETERERQEKITGSQCEKMCYLLLTHIVCQPQGILLSSGSLVSSKYNVAGNN